MNKKLSKRFQRIEKEVIKEIIRNNSHMLMVNYDYFNTDTRLSLIQKHLEFLNLIFLKYGIYFTLNLSNFFAEDDPEFTFVNINFTKFYRDDTNGLWLKFIKNETFSNMIKYLRKYSNINI